MNSRLEGKSVVYYDGSCPMCTVIINKVDGSSRSENFLMQDITKESLPQDFTRTDVEKEIHVVADGKVYKNAEAILKILEDYPTWKPFVWFGRLPIVKKVLPIGYNFIAANRHFLFGPASRIYWVKVVVSLGFIFGLLLSLKLWVSSRFFPLTPILQIFPTIPYPFDWGILFIIFGLLFAVIFSSKPKIYIWAVVAIVSILVCLDQQRLQPWVYQYLFMLAAIGFFSWKWNDIETRNKILNTCRFIIASIYFWSGVQKVNIEFIGGVFPWMITPIAQLFPSSVSPVFYTFGALVPFIEIGIGIGLITKKFRHVAIGLALSMCVLVLWTLGPFGYSWNSVVWPWNIAMVVLALLLFAKTKTVSMRDILWVKDSLFHKVILVVFGFLPLLYFFNLWDSYPSWSLYSGTTNQSTIYLNEDIKNKLPDYIKKFIEVDESNRNVLSLSDWSFGELNVPTYPEERIFKSITRSLCTAETAPKEVILVIHGRLSWFNRSGEQVLDCSELGKETGIFQSF